MSADSVLENTKTVDHWSRVLYVPSGIDWDTMWQHAIKLFKSGHKVQIHEHRWQDRCPVLDTDGAVKRCGQLTDGPDGPRLVLASQGPASVGAPGTIES